MTDESDQAQVDEIEIKVARGPRLPPGTPPLVQVLVNNLPRGITLSAPLGPPRLTVWCRACGMVQTTGEGGFSMSNEGQEQAKTCATDHRAAHINTLIEEMVGGA